MASRRREVGFWPLLASQTLGQLVGAPEFLSALALGGVGGWVLHGFTSQTDRIGVAGDFLAVAAPLLGIVFTALALVVSLFSSEYLRLLNEHPKGGIKVFLAPFMTAVGLQVGALLGSIIYRGIATDLPDYYERLAFAVLAFVFAWSILDVVALGRSVLLHAIDRARHAEVTGQDSTVRPLPRRDGKSDGGK